MIQVNVKAVLDVAEKLRRMEWEAKCKELCRRLTEIGAVVVNSAYDVIQYTGDKDYHITVEPTENGYQILASGESVLFLEFGAGVTYGYGHPQAQEFGMGPGTYPPTNPQHPHWNDPNGWYTPAGEHTYGNAPSMGMYYASKAMKEQIESIAQEVFGNDRRGE